MNAEQLEATLVNAKDKIVFVRFSINSGSMISIGGTLEVLTFPEGDIEYNVVAPNSIRVQFSLDSVASIGQTKNMSGDECLGIMLTNSFSLAAG